MIYKGHDLDLRTFDEAQRLPGARTFGTSGKTAVYKRTFKTGTPGQDTIWVDDSVMLLCNQAHDLASTLSAREIEPEHLVYAMTQLRSTADALNEHNIHVYGLRKEVSALMMRRSSDPSRDGKSSPRKSDAFENVLQAAAKRAYARRSPVAIEDLLDTLFNMSQASPVHKILQRHRDDFDLRETDDFDENDSIIERRRKVRVSAGRNYIGRTASLPNGVSTVTDTIQDSRMDSIERAIRLLTESMALRHAGQLGNDSHAVNGLRSSGLDEDEVYHLVRRVERNVNTKFAELARTWTVLGERLELLENAVEASSANAGRIDMPAELEERLKSLSGADARLEKLEELIKEVASRLEDFDKYDGNVEIAPVMSSLRDVEAGLRGLGGQMREIDSRTGDVNLLVDGVSDRQQKLETLIERQQDQIQELTSAIREEIREIAAAPVGSDANSERLHQAMQMSLRTLNETIERQNETVAQSVNRVMSERVTGLASHMQARLSRMEDLVKEHAERPVTVTESGFDASFLNDAVTKIINNQHTMAGSMDELRNQTRTQLVQLSTRLDALDMQPPVAVETVASERFDEISEQIRNLQSQIPQQVVQSDPWTRFKIWLFGTTDWYAASWNTREEDGLWRRPAERRDEGRADARGAHEREQRA